MTEDEWAEAEEEEIWRVLAPLSPRRQRLLAVVLARSIAHLATGDIIANALDVAEKFADTGKTKASLKRTRDALANARVAIAGDGRTQDRAVLGAYMAMFVASIACSENAVTAAVRETVLTWREAKGISKAEARRRVYPIFCEISGPAPSVAFPSAWRTSTVMLLAQQMYESRDFSAMPILADALQDAGCDNDDILNHCRAESLHVRGCWVVDLVLGKA